MGCLNRLVSTKCVLTVIVLTGYFRVLNNCLWLSIPNNNTTLEHQTLSRFRFYNNNCTRVTIPRLAALRLSTKLKVDFLRLNRKSKCKPKDFYYLEENNPEGLQHKSQTQNSSRQFTDTALEGFKTWGVDSFV